MGVSAFFLPPILIFMPVTYNTDGNADSKLPDCFRAAQRLRSPMAGRPALRGRSDPFD